MFWLPSTQPTTGLWTTEGSFVLNCDVTQNNNWCCRHTICESEASFPTLTEWFKCKNLFHWVTHWYLCAHKQFETFNPNCTFRWFEWIVWEQSDCFECFLVGKTDYQWSIFVTLKVISILMGMHIGVTKYCCFFCSWDNHLFMVLLRVCMKRNIHPQETYMFQEWTVFRSSESSISKSW